MSLSDLASLGSFVSGVAVLISLIFLYFQLRQVNRQVEQAERNQRGSVQQGRASRRVDLMLALANSDAADVYDRGMRGDELSHREIQQFRWMFRATLTVFEDTFLQHEEGLVMEPAFRSASDNLDNLISTPGGRVMWHQVRNNYHERFRELLDDKVRKTPLRRSADDAERWKLAIAEELKAFA